MKIIQIENPCEEKWDNMQNIPDGKFCDLCSKKVWDLDQLSDLEINVILKNNKAVCGKISSKKPILSSIFLALTLSATNNFHAQNNQHKSTLENVHQNEVTIKGKLVSIIAERKLISGEISLLTLDKLYFAKADENGNFTLTFPEKVLSEYNIVTIDCTLSDEKREYQEQKTSILKKEELLGKEEFEIQDRYVTIGAVSYTVPDPPDYYFLDGKKIGKRKFEKLKRDNPKYKYFTFYEENIVQRLTKKSFVDNLYLLYSN